MCQQRLSRRRARGGHRQGPQSPLVAAADRGCHARDRRALLRGNRRRRTRVRQKKVETPERREFKMANIAFIGLGNMGGPMAANLVKPGHKVIAHCGGASAGQAAKICNNMILAVSMIAVSEAFALAEKLGLSHQALFDVASTSSGQCWALTSYCPVPGPVPTSPANNDYKPGFASALMVKDLTLAQDAAKATGAATPLGKHAHEIYKAFDAAGNGGVDFSGIIRHVRGLAGK